jgi:glycosyltransferase involved in cell wall biosynthesis
MELYGSFCGFRYYIKPKPLLGAYVAMEAFARGLLKYGHFDEYHAYYDDEFLRGLLEDEAKRAYFRFEKLKVMRLKALVQNPDVSYRVLHFESFSPDEEVFFRNILSQKNIPVTRRVYAIATVAHLMSFLEHCLLTDGGRPYDSIIVPSKPTREALLAYYADVSSFTSGRLCYKGRVDVIPHGIHVEEFESRDKLGSREKFGIPPRATVLLSLARISWTSKMNYDRLLEFFSRLTQRTEAELLLVVTGTDSNNESQELLRLAKKLGIADKTKLITNFADESKADILACADIFISLSDNLQESFGINLIEAMAMGLPVLCTDWDGYKDIVDEGVTGYRIPTVWKATECREDVLSSFRNPYDHTAIHRASRDVRIDMDLLIARALELVRHEEVRRKMGQNGREKVERTYAIKSEISALEALWQELGEIARRDEREYTDLRPILNYNYPRHFRSYPTCFE